MIRPTLAILLAAIASVAAATELDAFDVPAFDYASLATNSPNLLHALQQDGIIALKNIPQYADLRAAYLREATKCAIAAGANGDNFLQYKRLQDGTQRYTISATSGKELSTASEDTRTRCPEYVAEYRALSELVETAVAALGKTLDATPFTVTSHEKLTGSQLMAESVHLDHFHAYEASPTRVANDDALLSLELHTDNGMLIAMTAPKYFDVSPSAVADKSLDTYESGLLIENRAGKLVKPTLKEDELVLMVGSGFQEWIRSSPALRPVPHAMKYPSLPTSGDEGARLIRAWFGKMVLLSAEERMLNVGMTFGEFASNTARYLMDHNGEEESKFASLACPRGRRLHESDGKCVVKQCTPKKGKDPELACSIQCNLSTKSRPGADRICEENCDCVEKPSNSTGEYCWMLCVSELPEGSCGAGVAPRCKTGKEAPYIVDQAMVCNVTTATAKTTSAEAVSAPSSAPVPSGEAATKSSAASSLSLAALATVACFVATTML